ncbi:MAG: hypothetical protein J7J96_05615 [Sulfurimonas sp.]|nr:hypothetical protein [Sulfurimonas sp.]
MNLSKISIVISILFAPSFILLLRYFDFKNVTLLYALFMFAYLVVLIFYKQELKTIFAPIIYFTFLILAYILSSMEFVKIIPALISAIFFLLFLMAYIQKKKLILSFTKKFYKKKLGEEEERYIAHGDGYWAVVTFINTLIQLVLAFYASDSLWAFYSSVGWYIYFFIALFFQIIYGKFYITKANQ